jgi:hypothetical protein
MGLPSKVSTATASRTIHALPASRPKDRKKQPLNDRTNCVSFPLRYDPIKTQVLPKEGNFLRFPWLAARHCTISPPVGEKTFIFKGGNYLRYSTLSKNNIAISFTSLTPIFDLTCIFLPSLLCVRHIPQCNTINIIQQLNLLLRSSHIQPIPPHRLVLQNPPRNLHHLMSTINIHTKLPSPTVCGDGYVASIQWPYENSACFRAAPVSILESSRWHWS